MTLFPEAAVWITGGGTGIGRALAVEFARQGANVAVSGRRAEALQETLDAIHEVGRVGVAVPCDVTDEAAVEKAVADVVGELGKLDVVVANAGFGVSGTVESLDAETWRRQLDTNVVGSAITVRHALPHLRKTRGRIGLVGSVAGMVVYPKGGAYAASKFAVRALGQTLAVELHGSGVSCTTMHPGFVESEIARVDNAGVHHPDRRDPRPGRFMWRAEDAARVMVRALYKRKREYVFTWHGRFAAYLGRHWPGLAHFVMTRAGGPTTRERE